MCVQFPGLDEYIWNPEGYEERGKLLPRASMKSNLRCNYLIGAGYGEGRGGYVSTDFNILIWRVYHLMGISLGFYRTLLNTIIVAEDGDGRVRQQSRQLP